MENLNNKFLFITELLHLIDSGKSITIEDASAHMEKGDIFEFINTSCGYDNINVKTDMAKDINSALEREVSENEATKRGIEKNGLIYVLSILVGDWMNTLSDMQLDEITSEE